MKQTKRTLVSLLLVFAMLATCLVAFSLTTSAANPVEDTNKDGTLPEGAEVKTGTATSFSGGDGTAENPYQIKDVTEFRYLQQMISADTTYLEKCYVLTGNLYYNNKVFPEYSETNLPNSTDTITSSSSTANRYQSDNTQYGAITGTFSGTFDGAGYGVYNSFMRFANAGGFFQNVTGTVKNLNFYGGYVLPKANGAGGSIVATLNGGTISNCYSSVGIESESASRIGGIVGIVNGNATIENCVYAGAIYSKNSNTSTDNQVGGIAGRVDGATLKISGCKNYAAIVTGSSRVGGMIGLSINSNVTLSDCANYGNVHGTSTAGDGGIGGIMGRSYSSAYTVSFTRCANYGNATADYVNPGRVSGIVGTAAGNESFISCANYGNITGKGASGIVAYATTSTIKNCYSEGTMINLDTTQSSYVLAGYVKTNSTVANCVGVTSSLLYTGDSTTVASNNKTYTAENAALTNGEALAILNTDNDGVWVQGTTAPELAVFYQAPTAVQVTLDGATLSLGDTMTLKLFVKASSVSEITDLATIMVNDGTQDYAGALEAETGNYVFEIAGLLAKDMGTAKTYKVKYTLTSDTANPIVCDTGVTYSPLQYAIRMYNKNKQEDGTLVDTNFAALLTSMVRYMDAAGATDAMTTFADATDYAFGDTTTAYTAIVEKDAQSIFTLTSATAELGAELTSGIILLVKPASGMTLNSVKIGTTNLTITIVDETETDIIWRVNGINPGDLYNELTFTFTNAADETVTGTYSVARYLDSYVGTASETLAKATALYMDAFTTYATMR